jgi:hypothetical protein
MRTPCVQVRDLFRVNVEPDNLVAKLRVAQCERLSHIAHAQDTNDSPSVFEQTNQLSGHSANVQIHLSKSSLKGSILPPQKSKRHHKQAQIGIQQGHNNAYVVGL